MLLLVMAT